MERGFGEKNLHRMIQFAEAYPDREIVVSLLRQLGWTHSLRVISDPMGMILCAGKSTEHIALLELQKSGIHVASYWTDLLPKRELERKLHEAVRLARARLGGAKGSACPNDNNPPVNPLRRSGHVLKGRSILGRKAFAQS